MIIAQLLLVKNGFIHLRFGEKWFHSFEVLTDVHNLILLELEPCMLRGRLNFVF